MLHAGQLLGVGGNGAAVDARPGPGQVDGAQPDEQGKRGDYLEVDQRLDAHAPYLLQVGVAGNAHDQRRKHERRDDSLHQA